MSFYEKNEDIAGTWLENRYPGAACDVPSHAYTYNFALKYVPFPLAWVPLLICLCTALIGLDIPATPQKSGHASAKCAKPSTFENTCHSIRRLLVATGMKRQGN